MSREVEILQGVTSSSRRTLHRRSRAAHATNQLGTFSLTMTLKQPLAALSQQASQRRMLGETVRTVHKQSRSQSESMGTPERLFWSYLRQQPWNK